MANGSDRKLNQLQQLPEDVLVDATWLERYGYSSSLRSQYVKRGWLNQPAPRVYRRASGPLDWRHVVTSLQSFMGYQLTVGGRTALEEHGYAHYLGERTEVHLYGSRKPPGWLDKLPLPVKFCWHNSSRLFPEEPDEAPTAPLDDLPPSSRLPSGFVASAGHMRWPMRLSSPERAVLELLDELPGRESFHQADMLMESLVNLSPRRMQPLLETCRSVKVKRLFFFLADRHHHAWRDALDKTKVDFGSGKRLLVKGGKLDPTYLITVPGDLDGVS